MDQSRQVFTVDLLERYASKGRGVITCMAAGNDVILLGTSKGWLIRHDFGAGGSSDFDLSSGRPGDQSIHRVFVDPGGSHCIATVIGGGGAETFYMHAKWSKPRVLGRLKGLIVNAVAWNRQLITEAPVLFWSSISELHFFIKQRRAMHFAWLSGAGIYHGGLNFGAQHSYINGDENFVENKALLDYSKLSDGADAVKPSSMAVSEFHFLLLIGNKVKVVNRISEQIIEELQFDQTSESVSRGVIGLCSDATAGLFYAYDQNSIFQVSVNDEGRDMWKVYLDMKEYAAALANCRDPLQRDQVYLVQADAAFTSRDFLRAASFYAKINYILSFEEVTLKFISVGEQDALRTFLLRKLDNLAKDDKCQITMISTWATELYLDKINRLLLEEDNALDKRSSEYQSINQEFCAFLGDCKDVLDEATTMRLLESYGRVEELVYFASLKEQYEIVIHHYIQQGETRKALEVLQKPAVPIDLQYKFAPDLIVLDAYETVESWMTTKNLNPRKLIPAMMRYSSEPHAKNETHEVIKYLEFCVHCLHNEDPGVHNLLLSLYAKQEDDDALLRFLQCKFGKGRENGPDFFYDPKYALRLCLKEKRMRACVHIYSMMSMHEEAVALALQVDPELAMAEADKVEDDEDLRKKLWLMVAKHVIEQEKGTKRENIRKAIAFLKETDGLLKIEDILPFFPDFALIDDFKEAICSSLEDYNNQIEQLKQEMNDATHGADNIRNDISALAQRYAVIDRDEECGVCKRKILIVGGDYRMSRGYTSVGQMAPFYVFPCGHAFHVHCLIAHVTCSVNGTQAEYILDLQKQLTLLGDGARKDMNGGITEDSITSMTPADKLRSQLDDAIASECPFCGELMIRQISLPFILSEEALLVNSWEIKPQNNLANMRTLSLPV
ncbi:PREDICTED: vacuolar protein sorting-associated protein 18 homolog [Populus euphratica]|uniref:Vacuolar protein sorting-associated protein 18 homolog n=1 Tax=Populus euphratica TaxID=75702 RepID=A0AAJ6VDM1_POPEU|nr:PREDICTED: vacuolar protein sorting-associated protein 18 homolog [Populus euphratica]